MASIRRFARLSILVAGLAALGCGSTETPELPDAPGVVIPTPADVAAAQLMDYIETFVGTDALECGQHLLPAGEAFPEPVDADRLEASVACAVDAAAAGRPFWTYSQHRGIDSWVASGLIGPRRGGTSLFFYDSAPSGHSFHPPYGRFSIQRCSAMPSVTTVNGAPTFYCPR